ncbi:MAG: DUF983 domain-containing protein [Bdellovibrionales bacterium]|nr:DUF983 domain-containing protein [Bdellovibrionales bacterium]
MHKSCPVCQVPFERESGYFIGAMIAAYFLGVFLALPILLLSVFGFGLSMTQAILLSSLQLVLLQPFLFKYSRILWIRVEAALTRSIHR